MVGLLGCNKQSAVASLLGSSLPTELMPTMPALGAGAARAPARRGRGGHVAHQLLRAAPVRTVLARAWGKAPAAARPQRRTSMAGGRCEGLQWREEANPAAGCGHEPACIPAATSHSPPFAEN